MSGCISSLARDGAVQSRIQSRNPRSRVLLDSGMIVWVTLGLGRTGAFECPTISELPASSFPREFFACDLFTLFSGLGKQA